MCRMSRMKCSDELHEKNRKYNMYRVPEINQMYNVSGSGNAFSR